MPIVRLVPFRISDRAWLTYYVQESSSSSNRTEPVLPRAWYVVNKRCSPPRMESPFAPFWVLFGHTLCARAYGVSGEWVRFVPREVLGST